MHEDCPFLLLTSRSITLLLTNYLLVQSIFAYVPVGHCTTTFSQMSLHVPVQTFSLITATKQQQQQKERNPRNLKGPHWASKSHLQKGCIHIELQTWGVEKF